VTTWGIGEAAAKCGLSRHTLRWYERIGLLAKIERDEVRRALASQRECLKLLDAKIDYYANCLALAPQANAL